MPIAELIHSSLFLGMHSTNEKTRVSCKNYFVERLSAQVSMSLEHIGGCDHVIWLYPRELQDAYYPFMDNLHTMIDMSRLPYSEDVIRLALEDSQIPVLSMYDQLLVALAKSQKATIYTVNKELLNQGTFPVCSPEFSEEKSFPNFLESLYRISLQLRIPDSQLTGDHHV